MIIDLSQPYQTGMQVYPGTPEVLIDVSDSHGWICSQLNMSTHAGTHIDALLTWILRVE
jgi:kynurenine formamidase